MQQGDLLATLASTEKTQRVVKIKDFEEKGSGKLSAETGIHACTVRITMHPYA